MNRYLVKRFSVSGRSSYRSVGCNHFFPQLRKIRQSRSSYRSVGCNMTDAQRDRRSDVAPRTGAWVAIKDHAYSIEKQKGRSSYRSVGCNLTRFSTFTMLPGRSSYRSVGCNMNAMAAAQRNIRSLLVQERGLQF